MSTHPAPRLPDFDSLSKLARDDPQAFEELRRSLVNDLIDNAPQARQARLRGLQFRVDTIRRLSKSELGAAVKIYELMWRSFRSLADEWSGLRNGTTMARRRSEYRTAPSAKVLVLRPHH